ncbi:MAG: dihydrodipicolinate synthase family protein [Gammaproteobacteria bacterium]|nr:dihydrodipicolinate synthase family protein [Gammaproteobacteria bacterium]
MHYSKKEAKDWARETYQGLDTTILPCFTPDTLELDEAGIRHDMRMLLPQGFFAVTLVSGGESGTTLEEDKRFVEYCVDEAGGKIGVTLNVRYYTLEDNIAMARHAEAVGCHSIMVSYPTNFHPRDENEIYAYTKAICDATNLGVILFPSVKNDFAAPYRVSAQTLSRLADLDNVIAMKIGMLEWTWIDECFRRFGERVLISYPFDDAWPTMIGKYGMQWSGAAPWHNMQTAADPRSVQMFNCLREGRMDEASAIYWRMDPLRKAILAIALPSAQMGMYNFDQWKYLDGLLGFTGGELRMPKLSFFGWQREQLRMALLASGLQPAGSAAAPARVAATA